MKTRSEMIGKRGVTLVELMIVCLILIIVLSSLWQIFIRSLECIAEAQALNIATDDMRDVLEKIKSVPFTSVTKVFDPIPEVDGGGSEIEDGIDIVSGNIIGGFTLENEAISVQYFKTNGTPIDNPTLLANMPDPLIIHVQAAWRVKGRNMSQRFRIARTSVL